MGNHAETAKADFTPIDLRAPSAREYWPASAKRCLLLAESSSKPDGDQPWTLWDEFGIHCVF